MRKNKTIINCTGIFLKHLKALTIDLATPNDSFKVVVECEDEYQKNIFKILHDLDIYGLVGIEDYLPSNYKDFLRTPYWKIIAFQVKERYNFKCAICSSNHNLNAHHRTYDRIGQEYYYWKSEKDLICLCEECHALFHKNSKLVECNDE